MLLVLPHSIGNSYNNSNDNDNLFVRLEGVLVDLESRNGITQRWTTACEEYQLARDACNDKSKKAALGKVHTKVIERWFLLSLKAKYADTGRSVAFQN